MESDEWTPWELDEETMDEDDRKLHINQKYVIVDACVNGSVGDYLKEMGYNVLYIADEDQKMGDKAIKQLGHDMSAIIITADRKGFRDYENRLLVKSSSSPKRIYRKLRELDSLNDSAEL